MSHTATKHSHLFTPEAENRQVPVYAKSRLWIISAGDEPLFTVATQLLWQLQVYLSRCVQCYCIIVLRLWLGINVS